LIGPARIAAAGLAYFALGFGAGFLMGAIRVPFLVPRLGARVAELLEMPFMLLVIFFAARFVVRRFALGGARAAQLAAGGIALVLLLAAEVTLAVVLQDQSLRDYIESRDPVSGGVYLAMLGVFALMPFLVDPGRK
jgi:hypothetical protein